MPIRSGSPVLAFAFVIAFALTDVPAYAQGNGNGNGNPPSNNSVAAQVADLAARVAKLEGNLTSADLVGTYTIAGIQTRLLGLGLQNSAIGSAALFGSMTLNADGSGSLQISGDGSLLLTGNLSLIRNTLGNGNPGPPFPFSGWTYANGVLTIPQVGNATVGPGGRLMVGVVPEFDTTEGRADVSLVIFYRR